MAVGMENWLRITFAIDPPLLKEGSAMENVINDQRRKMPYSQCLVRNLKQTVYIAVRIMHSHLQLHNNVQVPYKFQPKKEWAWSVQQPNVANHLSRTVAKRVSVRYIKKNIYVELSSLGMVYGDGAKEMKVREVSTLVIHNWCKSRASRGKEAAASTPKTKNAPAGAIYGLNYTDIQGTQIRKVSTKGTDFLLNSWIVPLLKRALLRRTGSLSRSSSSNYSGSINGQRTLSQFHTAHMLNLDHSSSLSFLEGPSLKVAALAVKKVPHRNSSWTNDYIRQYHNVNINVAVQTDNRLYVPVTKFTGTTSKSSIIWRISAYPPAHLEIGRPSLSPTMTEVFNIQNLAWDDKAGEDRAAAGLGENPVSSGSQMEGGSAQILVGGNLAAKDSRGRPEGNQGTTEKEIATILTLEAALLAQEGGLGSRSADAIALGKKMVSDEGSSCSERGGEELRESRKDINHGGNQNRQLHKKAITAEGSEYELTFAELEINRKFMITQRRKESKWKKNLKYSRRQSLSQIKNKQEIRGAEGGGKTLEDIVQNTKPLSSGADEEMRERRVEALLTYQQAKRLGLEGLAPEEEMIQQLINLG
ncbi:hypothetical protein QQ045_012094 [Rhodiola kirilowii]